MSFAMKIFSEPNIRIRIGVPPCFSYSDITCLHAPQGVTGLEVNPLLSFAAIAMAVILASGYVDLAENIATLSAHNPDG